MKKKRTDAVEKGPAQPSAKTNGLGRRDFGRLVMFTLAGSALAITPPAASGGGFDGVPRLAFREQEETQAGLSSAGQAEVEAKLRHILATYGDRLNHDQKQRMRRIVSSHVRMLEAIRPIPTTNGDPPATVLKLIDKSTVRAGRRPRRTSRAMRKAAKSPKKEL
ncbi:MAG TPA: hypothetical protein VKS20_12920 [Candidatus Acidoferrales bacterium]|nr:hypothetical protein [Candidatus Acidoferrales bacterium]